MSESGHEPTFSTAWRSVWNAAISRHSAPNVGNVSNNLPPMNGRMLLGVTALVEIGLGGYFPRRAAAASTTTPVKMGRGMATAANAERVW